MGAETTIDRILLLLEEKHIKKVVFCKDVGIPKSSFYLWVKNKNKNVVSGKYLVQIAEYLGVSLDYLLRGKEPNEEI